MLPSSFFAYIVFGLYIIYPQRIAGHTMTFSFDMCLYLLLIYTILIQFVDYSSELRKRVSNVAT